jgi:hypothetical protein
MYRSRTLLFYGLAASLILSLLALVYPIYVIRPFRRQMPAELALAMQVMRYRPVLEGGCVLVALAFCMLIFRHFGSIKARVAAIVCVVLVFASAALSRVNIYEQMFHPAEKPAYAAIAQTKLAAAEPVIAISLDGAARAYPIRIISYHHIINDTLAGEPVVATY